MKPLTGLRVIGLTHVAAGPFAMSLLGDFGADVVNVESFSGDNMRSRDGSFTHSSAYFYGVNRNKRSLACDIKTPAGREIMERLLARSDVFVHNLSRSAIERLDLGFSRMHSDHPRLIYAEISAWGGAGPDRDKLGMDILAQARSGLMGITGHPGAGPAKVPVPISDLVTGILTAMGVILALVARGRDGLGQKVETSLLHGNLALMANLIPYFFATGKPTEPLGSGHPQIAPYQAFPAADGFVIIACLTQQFWLKFCTALQLDYLAADSRFATPDARVRNREDLASLVTEITRSRPREALAALLESHGVPCGPVATLKDVFADPQVSANHMIQSLYQCMDNQEVPVLGVPVHLSRTPGSLDRGAPALGEHSFEILQELRYSEAEWTSLVEAGVVKQPGS